MVKKIGELFIFLLTTLHFAIICAISTSISIAVLDHNGRPTKQVAVGIPFLIEVTVQGEDVAGTPNVDRIGQLHIQDQSMSTMRTTINGVTTIKKIYRYKMRADKEGVFTIGPAKIQTSQGVIQSMLVNLMVSATPVQSAEHEQAFIKLLAEPNHAVVGQKISIRIRFYFQENTSLTGISDPQLPHGSKQLEGPFSGQEIINGCPMRYLEWQSFFYPKVAGDLLIPAVRATYRVQSPSRRSTAFDLFSAFLDGSMEQHYVYSNALSISVDQLPTYHEQVYAVGVLDKAKITIDRDGVSVGDGLVLKLTVEGKGNFDTMAAPLLKLPAEITYYESTAHQEVVQGERERKTFEYILQAKQAGTFTIPVQEIPFFNIQTHQYEQLKTQPVTIHIIGKAAQSILGKPSSTRQPIENEDTQHIQDQLKMPLTDVGSIAAKDEWQIPLHYFWTLLALILVLVGAVFSIGCYRRYCLARAGVHAKAYAFKKAKKALDSANTHNKRFLYDIFISLFAARTGRALPEVDEDFIKQTLVEKEVPKDRIDQWQDFFTRCSEYAFFAQEYDKEYIQTLYKKAFMWLEELKKYI